MSQTCVVVVVVGCCLFSSAVGGSSSLTRSPLRRPGSADFLPSKGWFIRSFVCSTVRSFIHSFFLPFFLLSGPFISCDFISFSHNTPVIFSLRSSNSVISFTSFYSICSSFDLHYILISFAFQCVSMRFMFNAY